MAARPGAGYQLLDARDDRIGFDRAWRTIERRRKNVYRCVRRWCPGGTVWRLGRRFFDLAGLDDVEIY